MTFTMGNRSTPAPQDVQARLNQVYRSIIEHLRQHGRVSAALDDLDGPFLVASNQTYERSVPRVVIVGQVNNGWLDKSCRKVLDDNMTVDQLVKRYGEFNPRESYHTTFFQYFERLRDDILARTPADPIGPRCG